MALQFYIGGSGTGKSTKLHQDIIEEARNNPNTNYLVIVPDQFTMQTQMDFVTEHPDHGIMNIDVLSFGRLSHRILEEVGADRIPVLDDTGKSLILRRIAEQMKEQLPALGSNLKKLGYVNEVKSAISEFMQYGIFPDDVHELITYAKGRGALTYKLADLEILYRAFLEAIDEKYVTREEKLNLLKNSLHKSKVVKDSVVVFDGFTGFTPVQYGVIEELMVLAKKVVFTIILDTKENPYCIDGEQRLFHLSKKTVNDIKKLADRVSIPEIAPVIMDGEKDRFGANAELRHLEQNLFRYPSSAYENEVSSIHLMRANTIRDEVQEVCLFIKRMVREKGCCYRDIAVVTGNMEGYARHLEQMLDNYEIPAYIDNTKSILQNAFTRFVRCALQVLVHDFSIDSVMQYLRTGFSDLSINETDLLENYLRKCGIRGKSSWTKVFAAKGKEKDKQEEIDKMEQLNSLREQVMDSFEPLLRKNVTADDYISHLYEFLVKNHCQEKLAARSEYFEEHDEPAKAKEYGQLYRLTMELLEQMQMLLGDEEMTFDEFVQILETGFGEIQVGTIPQEVDRVLIGDIERTRLKQVKVLFFLGINDGNIPKNASKGGIISDLDREFLQQSQYEFAPSPRQQMFIQRLYLYINMTKPSEQLYLSFANMDESGTTLTPSYLVDVIKNLFPKLNMEYAGVGTLEERMESMTDADRYFAEAVRRYADGRLCDTEERKMKTIYLHGSGPERMKQLSHIAFDVFNNTNLSRQIAEVLYGKVLEGSISRFEQYAKCAYSHFLQYGLSLKEREEFSFEAIDLGNVFHDVLEKFGVGLKTDGYSWMDFPDEYADAKVDSLLEQCAVEYGDTILYSTAQMKHSLENMGRMLKRSVHTMKDHLAKGRFMPSHFEMSFETITDLEDVKLGLSADEKLRMRGRVDRIDSYEENDKLYIKIMDYKTGQRKFDLAAIYYGVQLQLVVYMDSVKKMEQKKHPDKEVVPAAVLYYRVQDPLVDETAEMDVKEIEAALKKELRTTGVVSADKHVVDLLDEGLNGTSEVIPVTIKKDGSYNPHSHVIGDEDLSVVTNYVNHKIKQMGQNILLGDVEAKPSSFADPCKYCDFAGVCDRTGRRLYSSEEKRISGEEALIAMKESLEKEETLNEQHAEQE